MARECYPRGCSTGAAGQGHVYGALNRATLSKVFLIPNSDHLKATVAGNEILRCTGLGKRTSTNATITKRPAVRWRRLLPVAHIPKGLSFGPTHGPKDFQEHVFIVFARRLHHELYLFSMTSQWLPGDLPRTRQVLQGPTTSLSPWRKLLPDAHRSGDSMARNTLATTKGIAQFVSEKLGEDSADAGSVGGAGVPGFSSSWWCFT
jgi:hypothetical protein